MCRGPETATANRKAPAGHRDAKHAKAPSGSRRSGIRYAKIAKLAKIAKAPSGSRRSGISYAKASSGPRQDPLNRGTGPGDAVSREVAATGAQ